MAAVSHQAAGGWVALVLGRAAAVDPPSDEEKDIMESKLPWTMLGNSLGIRWQSAKENYLLDHLRKHHLLLLQHHPPVL
jgi:hypothetical protein